MRSLTHPGRRVLLPALVTLALGVVADVDDLGAFADLAAIVAIVAALAFIAIVLPAIAAGSPDDEAPPGHHADRHEPRQL